MVCVTATDLSLRYLTIKQLCGST